MKEIEKIFNPDTSKEELEAILKANPNLASLAIFVKLFNYNDNIQTNI